MQFIVGSHWMVWFMRAMGAKIGQDVYLGPAYYFEHSMLSIGSFSTIDTGSFVECHDRTLNTLNFGKIIILWL